MSKAIVLASPRSGSEMLIYGLNQHPLIRAESELIGDSVRRCGEGISRLSIMQFYFDEQRLLKDNRKYIFKAMYDQLDGECWRWIGTAGIKIIHLVREDYLRQVISHEFMRRMAEVGRTSAKAFEPMPLAQLNVDIDWVVHTLTQRVHEVALHREMIKYLPHLELKYTDLVDVEGKEIDCLPSALTKKVIDFLDIPYPVLATKLRKQNPRDLRKSVLNYDELLVALKQNGLEQYICE